MSHCVFCTLQAKLNHFRFALQNLQKSAEVVFRPFLRIWKAELWTYPQSSHLRICRSIQLAGLLQQFQPLLTALDICISVYLCCKSMCRRHFCRLDIQVRLSPLQGYCKPPCILNQCMHFPWPENKQIRYFCHCICIYRLFADHYSCWPIGSSQRSINATCTYAWFKIFCQNENGILRRCWRQRTICLT